MVRQTPGVLRSSFLVAAAIAAWWTLGAADAPPPVPPAPPPPGAAPTSAKPAGDVVFFKLFHKSDAETMKYLQSLFPEWVEQGNVRSMDPPTGTLIVIGDDAMKKAIMKVVDDFDSAGLKIEAKMLKLKHCAPNVALQLMGIAGVCNIWFNVSEQRTKSWQVDKNTHTFTVVAPSYSQWEPATQQKPGGEVLPFNNLPQIPYVCEAPIEESFELPTISGNAEAVAKQAMLVFKNTSSTEDRNRLLVMGTEADYERIKAFVETIDRPARQIMLEVQIVELVSDSLKDIGIDAFQYGARHSIVGFNTALPGESIPGVGFPDNLIEQPAQNLPDATRAGFQYLVDSSSVNIASQLAGSIRALQRTGDARVKARPKLITLDDRQNILHIGKEVPTFDGTAVTHDTQQGNLVSNVNKVTKEYVGITLNLRPRITGEDNQEVVIQMDIAVNELGNRERVFAEDLLGVPTIAVRRFTGQARVKNHVPIILGGLIQEQENESTSRVALLGDIPFIGGLFGRKLEEKSRTEIIIIIAPHILAENDPTASPRESPHFDTEDSVLFNDRYILRGRDLIGVDQATGEPVNNGNEVFTRQEVIELTLLHIVKDRRLVQKLRILDEYLPEEGGKLSWWKRKWPDQTVVNWTRDEQDIYYRAAAYAIETIKNLNPELDYEEIIKVRREITLPTSSNRVSLTYDKVKTLNERGWLALRGGKLDKETMDLLAKASNRTFNQFARYIERTATPANAHGDLREELLTIYAKMFPDGEDLRSLEYPDVLRELGNKGINFATLTTYFSENEGRYKELDKTPDLGILKFTLEKFLESSVPIAEKARELQELDDRWQQFQTAGDK